MLDWVIRVLGQQVQELRWLAYIVLTGCGRFHFDAIADAGDARSPCLVAVHDEDTDSVDDACDVCPHVPDPSQADADGDRVGDACDPEPDIARQRIELFDPFVALDPAWTLVGATVSGDELVLPALGSGRYVLRPLVSMHDTFVIGGTAGPLGTSGQRLIAILLAPASEVDLVYCELYDATSSTLKLTYKAGTVFSTLAQMVLPTRIGDGSGTLSYEISPGNTACTSTWHGEPVAISGARPAVQLDTVELYAEDVDVRIAYFVQIRTQD